MSVIGVMAFPCFATPDFPHANPEKKSFQYPWKIRSPNWPLGYFATWKNVHVNGNTCCGNMIFVNGPPEMYVSPFNAFACIVMGCEMYVFSIFLQIPDTSNQVFVVPSKLDPRYTAKLDCKPHCCSKSTISVDLSIHSDIVTVTRNSNVRNTVKQ
eukprot:71051_1